jgi:hypothetical protein
MIPAADARRFVAEHGLEDHVQKAATDAPPLTDPQRDALRHIRLSGHDDGAGTDTDPISDQGIARRGLQAS